MTYRRNRRAEERRRHVVLWLLKLASFVLVLAVTAYYAYQVGFRVAQADVAALRADLSQALASAERRQAEILGERQALVEARQQATEFKGLYDQERPSDDLRALTAMLRAKLAEGMDARRLSFVIRSARKPHDCEELGSKRFLVRTPRYRGPVATTMVRFDDAVTISAEGMGANAGHEQWFDSDRPVKVRLTASGLKAADLAGKLPLEETVAVRNSEYHFTMTAANARGWVDVATERCNFR